MLLRPRQIALVALSLWAALPLPAALGCEDLLGDLRTGQEIAADAGLHYASPTAPGISRVKDGDGFRYVDPDGKAIRDAKTLARIRALGIPPAHEEVWIAADPLSHIQAIGIDARGRHQYRYHAEWSAAKKVVKFARMALFGETMPSVRDALDSAIARKGLGRERVLAAIVEVMDATSIRVGNEKYAREHGTYGLTTFRKSHVSVKESRVRFSFVGKSSVPHAIEIEDEEVAKVVKALLDLPGERLFQWKDADGALHAIDAADVNAFLRGIGGGKFSAKDFRTWAGTTTAARKLMALGPPASGKALKENLKAAIAAAAERLGNTPSVCESSYIHPRLLAAYSEAFESGGDFHALAAKAEAGSDGWLPEERLVLWLLGSKKPVKTNR